MTTDLSNATEIARSPVLTFPWSTIQGQWVMFEGTADEWDNVEDRYAVVREYQCPEPLGTFLGGGHWRMNKLEADTEMAYKIWRASC